MTDAPFARPVTEEEDSTASVVAAPRLQRFTAIDFRTGRSALGEGDVIHDGTGLIGDISHVTGTDMHSAVRIEHHHFVGVNSDSISRSETFHWPICLLLDHPIEPMEIRSGEKVQGLVAVMHHASVRSRRQRMVHVHCVRAKPDAHEHTHGAWPQAFRSGYGLLTGAVRRADTIATFPGGRLVIPDLQRILAEYHTTHPNHVLIAYSIASGDELTVRLIQALEVVEDIPEALLS